MCGVVCVCVCVYSWTGEQLYNCGLKQRGVIYLYVFMHIYYNVCVLFVCVCV